ncbi:hypothetical protein [Staphylococcus caeli]|uniref:hypothetical protein n=1 Tax=Staphylococcus caeli TaxID=2201815 RepID=UPI003F56C111
MTRYNQLELKQSKTQLLSMLSKCENALEKMEYNGNPRSRTTLLENRIQALKLALALIEEQLEI